SQRIPYSISKGTYAFLRPACFLPGGRRRRARRSDPRGSGRKNTTEAGGDTVEKEIVMIEYVVRLVFLCLATLFFVNLSTGILIRLLPPAILHVAARMRATNAARVAFGFRMVPFALALLVVFGLCVPAYLQFEPINAKEDIGPVCSVGAVLGLFAIFRPAK